MISEISAGESIFKVQVAKLAKVVKREIHKILVQRYSFDRRKCNHKTNAAIIEKLNLEILKKQKAFTVHIRIHIFSQYVRRKRCCKISTSSKALLLIFMANGKPGALFSKMPLSL